MRPPLDRGDSISARSGDKKRAARRPPRGKTRIRLEGDLQREPNRARLGEADIAGGETRRLAIVRVVRAGRGLVADHAGRSRGARLDARLPIEGAARGGDGRAVRVEGPVG